MRPDTGVVAFGQLNLARMGTREAGEWILERARQRMPCVVVTSNIYHLKLSETDERFRDVIRRCELNVADGWPIVLATRLVRSGVPERVAGIDLVASLLESQPRLQVAVLGGPPGAAEELGQRYADLHDIVLIDPLPVGSWDSVSGLTELSRTMRDAEPNLVLIGIGPPRQELLADHLRSSSSGPIVCCGASIEVLAGARPRAPRWMQAIGLEWAFRVGLEPRRLGRRYVSSGAWFARVLVRELRSTRQPVTAG